MSTAYKLSTLDGGPGRDGGREQNAERAKTVTDVWSEVVKTEGEEPIFKMGDEVKISLRFPSNHCIDVNVYSVKESEATIQAEGVTIYAVIDQGES